GSLNRENCDARLSSPFYHPDDKENPHKWHKRGRAVPGQQPRPVRVAEFVFQETIAHQPVSGPIHPPHQLLRPKEPFLKFLDSDRTGSRSQIPDSQIVSLLHPTQYERTLRSAQSSYRYPSQTISKNRLPSAQRPSPAGDIPQYHPSHTATLVFQWQQFSKS